MSNRKKAPSNHYHHGNLERALIEAGLAVVEKGGIEALSLRAVARRAKVSHTAPYHHFAGKSELLAAVAAAGFDQMVAAIQEQAAAQPADDPWNRLRAVGLGYITFALAHPPVFRLMFRPELTSPRNHPRLIAAEARAFDSLLESIATLQQSKGISGHDPRPPSAFAWSTVHGLATLHLDEVFAETPIGKLPIQKVAVTINEAVVSGLKAHHW